MKKYRNSVSYRTPLKISYRSSVLWKNFPYRTVVRALFVIQPKQRFGQSVSTNRWRMGACAARGCVACASGTLKRFASRACVCGTLPASDQKEMWRRWFYLQLNDTIQTEISREIRNLLFADIIGLFDLVPIISNCSKTAPIYRPTDNQSCSIY